MLREITHEDTAAIFCNFSDPEVARWFFEQPLTEISQSTQFIESFITEFEEEKGLTWAITSKENSTCIGTCGYGEIEMGNRGELGFDLAKEYWDKGIMSECLKRVIEYSFTALHLLKVEAHTYSHNDRARHLLEKLGFQLDHISEDSHYYFLSTTGELSKG
ncbi:MAG TPA: GNAT family N-acetyltransferase [Anaerolineales bacterium]|nr:GNAT family N-acetyltransferase [Anaerolineales bacterium]